jgi:hypothetical protein
MTPANRSAGRTTPPRRVSARHIELQSTWWPGGTFAALSDTGPTLEMLLELDKAEF